MKYAALDVGSNSVRYLAVEFREGHLIYLASGTEVTRLTEGIGEGRVVIGEQALDRTVNALQRHTASLDSLNVDPCRRAFFATESIRSASNAGEVCHVLEDASGLPLEVLSGEQEGFYSARGALLSGLGGNTVFDLGGGSLELYGPSGGVSLPLGAVRMKALFDEDGEAISQYVSEALEGAGASYSGPLLGVGGTSSSLAMVLEEISVDSYHPSRLHGRKMSLHDLRKLACSLQKSQIRERRRVVGLEPKRADIIVSGLFVIVALLDYLGFESYRHSESDLLWGRVGATVEADGLSVSDIQFPLPREDYRGAGQAPLQTL